MAYQDRAKRNSVVNLHQTTSTGKIGNSTLASLHLITNARFWGVFWIDASSHEQAKQSFSTIARVGKIEPNERAAKSWLSSLGREQPWLLIIDNADDDSFPVEDLFPDGDGGIILITTKNPTLKVHGTIGPRYYHFGELEETESIELLLRAAMEPLPWSPSTLEPAKHICRTLGYLPLALMHAGKTILARLCTLENYLSFFEKNWNRIRRARTLNSTGSSVSDANAAIYSSFEVLRDGLVAKGTQASEDALDLLKIFSFLHRQQIRVDIFLRAASSPRLEMLERKQRDQQEKEARSQVKLRTTWAQTFKRLGLDIIIYLLQLGSRPALPRLLSDALESESFNELRLRKALKELFQMSLIFANSDANDDRYSMHPVVHLWVRERPEMTIGDQAVWCQVATTILSRAILLPPLGDKEEDEIFRRDLLPHVSHVQVSEQNIRAKFLENQESRRRVWPLLQPRLGRDRALQLVKFSLVYAQCGFLEEAEKLQSQVAEFAIKTLGMEHTATMDIMLLLSGTYWQLTRGEEAADLQQRVLEASIKVRGKDDLKTLKIMDAYGSSRWQQGRIPEAKKIHETAVEGLTRVLGDDHVDTLRAMGNLGRAVGKDFRFTEAIELHSKVVSGLRHKLGVSHLDTLTATDNLAMAYFDRAAFGYGHPGDVDHALEMEQRVFDQRREKLGREHLFTLWAGLNLARIRALRGEIDEALAVFLPGHAIARRNLGETHFGVLFGKLHYGRILIYAKKYEEAEDLLSEVIESHDEPRKAHPDRLLGIASLIKCRNLQGKQAETIALLEELTQCTIALFGSEHAWVKYMLDYCHIAEDTANITPESTGSLERFILCSNSPKLSTNSLA